MESGQRGKTSNKKKAGYKVEQFLEDLQKTIDVTIKSPAKEEYETVVKCKHGNLAWVNQRKDWVAVSIFPPDKPGQEQRQLEDNQSKDSKRRSKVDFRAKRQD